MCNGIGDRPNELVLTKRQILAAGLGAVLTPMSALLQQAAAQAPALCGAATGGVAGGPYYIDRAIMRSDVRDGQPGQAITLRVEVVDRDCRPLDGAVLSIWQANALGYYSGYLHLSPDVAPDMRRLGDASGHIPEEGPERFLRGIQTSAGGGKAVFTTIIPGWYMPRTPHIHVRAHLEGRTPSSVQLYFSPDVLATVYATEPYRRRGAAPVTNEADFVRQRAGQRGADSIIAVSTGADGTLAATARLIVG